MWHPDVVGVAIRVFLDVALVDKIFNKENFPC